MSDGVIPRLGFMLSTLQAAHVPVAPSSGWDTRGHPGPFVPAFIVWHHDGSPAGPSDTLSWCINGDADLPGPVCHVWVDYQGVWHLIASGLAWHAGKGGPYETVPADQMNTYSIGIETDHTVGEPWPAAQLDSLRRGTAALLVEMDQPASQMLFHKTWAPGRKIDPDGLDLSSERATLAKLMAPPAPTPITEDDDMTELWLLKGTSSGFFLNGGKAVTSNVNSTRTEFLAAGGKRVDVTDVDEFNRLLKAWS